MRRVDRVRFERRRRLAGVFGLAFTLGALTAGVAIWRADYIAARYTRGGFPLPVESTEAIEAPGDEPAAIPGVPAAVTAAPLPAPTATSGSGGDDADEMVRTLRGRRLELPVDGVSRSQLRDSFDERRSGIRRHEAIDIMVPRGTPVRAVENGRVAKLFRSVAGGLTIYLFDPSETFAYYYAHLDRYAAGLEDGEAVRRGEVIGYAGSTGNASEESPHLHFAIFQLGPERRWWDGDAVNPFPVLR